MMLSKSTMGASLLCLRDICVQSEEVCQSLLVDDVLAFFVMVVRTASFGKENSRRIVDLFRILAENPSLTQFQATRLMGILRSFLSTRSLQFLLVKSLQIFHSLFSNRSFAIQIFSEHHIDKLIHKLASDRREEVAIEAVRVIGAYFRSVGCQASNDVNYEAIFKLLVSQNDAAVLCALQTVVWLICPERIGVLADLGLFEMLKERRRNGSFEVKYWALSGMIAIVKCASMDVLCKCVEFDFVEDFVSMFEIHTELAMFNASLGALARVLLRRIDFDPPDICWIQFFEHGGVECLESLCECGSDGIAQQAERFLHEIVMSHVLRNGRT
jgi:hypothetical protein